MLNKRFLKETPSNTWDFELTRVVAGDDPNKQTRNKTSRGVSQQVRLGTILRVGKNKKTTENQRWPLTVI